jgi:hypothetical protein
MSHVKHFLQEKAVEATKQKEEKRKTLSPRNRKACHSVSTALLKSVAEIGTQSAMKSSKKTLHEFTSHIPPKTPKKEHKYFEEQNIADGHNCHSARSESHQHPCQGSDDTQGMPGIRRHQNTQAINQLSRHRRQPVPSSTAMVAMDRLN